MNKFKLIRGEQIEVIKIAEQQESSWHINFKNSVRSCLIQMSVDDIQWALSPDNQFLYNNFNWDSSGKINEGKGFVSSMNFKLGSDRQIIEIGFANFSVSNEQMKQNEDPKITSQGNHIRWLFRASSLLSVIDKDLIFEFNNKQWKLETLETNGFCNRALIKFVEFSH